MAIKKNTSHKDALSLFVVFYQFFILKNYISSLHFFYLLKYVISHLIFCKNHLLLRNMIFTILTSIP